MYDIHLIIEISIVWRRICAHASAVTFRAFRNSSKKYGWSLVPANILKQLYRNDKYNLFRLKMNIIFKKFGHKKRAQKTTFISFDTSKRVRVPIAFTYRLQQNVRNTVIYIRYTRNNNNIEISTSSKCICLAEQMSVPFHMQNTHRLLRSNYSKYTTRGTSSFVILCYWEHDSNDFDLAGRIYI